MAKCEVCGKKPMSGNNVSFSQRHTRRKWKPNVQKTSIFKSGRLQTVRICSRCLRTESKS
jgi:large subunit ribosomal protein L28